MKLSIAVITMNRSAQLIEALDSCLACNLPKDTEFIVIDNASTDDTEQRVKERLDNCGYSYYYEKLPENIGAGAGRCYAYTKTTGQYVYGFDDDAVVSDSDPDFFVKAIAIFEKDESIVTLATQVYDTAWEKNRQERTKVKVAEGIYLCSMFSGGSHFLKKEFFPEPPYFKNIYGYEELPPCLMAFDAGKKSVFCENLLAIHKPKVYKWNYNDKNNAILVRGLATLYVIRSKIYPRIFKPLLYVFYRLRRFKLARGVKDARTITKEVVRETKEQASYLKRIKVKTVFRLYKYFGISVF